MDPASSLAVVAVCCSLHVQFEGIKPELNPGHYNQFNPGASVEFSARWGEIAIGGYDDSYNKGASFVTYSPCTGYVRPFVGVVDGYHFLHFRHLAPAAGLNLEPWHKEGPTFTVTPMNLHGIVIGFAWKESVF